MINFDKTISIGQEVTVQTTLYTVPVARSASLVSLQAINASTTVEQTISVYKNAIADGNLIWPKTMALGVVGEDTQYISDDTVRDLVAGDTIIVVPSGALTITGTILEGDE